jgi:phosphonate transport system substrate-binding protein
MVLAGQADATAIDSHVLDVLRARDEHGAVGLRAIDMLGPSSIPPIVVSKRVDQQLKREIQEILVTMHLDAASALHKGLIERFVAVADKDYDDIRGMLERVEEVEFPFE